MFVSMCTNSDGDSCVYQGEERGGEGGREDVYVDEECDRLCQYKRDSLRDLTCA